MSEWQPIETAPKDRTVVDLWAKRWKPETDGFEYRRFADCHWVKCHTGHGGGGGFSASTGARTTYVETGNRWHGLDKEWRATHWMPLPDPPRFTSERAGKE